MNKRKLFSLLLIIVPMAAVILIAFSNQELSDAVSALRSMDVRWLACIFLSWFLYIFFDATGIWMYLRGQGFSLSLGRSLLSNFIGLYYSNITPGSAGGQPMQINSLRKAGIPVAYGTMAITIRFISNQFMVCVLSLTLFLINRDFVYRQLGDAIWFVRLGWVINFAALPLVLLAAFKKSWILKILTALISFLARIHLIKNKDAAISNITEILDTYHFALQDLLHHGFQIVVQMLLGALSITCLMGTIVFVYHALGLSGTPWIHILTIAFLLFISASYTPLPGASGAQEGGFLLYFQGIFTGGTIGIALLIWRFFTYYLSLLIGVFIQLLEKFLTRRRASRPAPAASGDNAESSQKGSVSNEETSDNRDSQL